jgi:hypothetical protein
VTHNFRNVALAATVDLILFLAFPHASYHSCVALVLAKLYSNSLLVLFNFRIRILGSRGTKNITENSYVGSNIKASTSGGGRATGRNASTPLNGVHVYEQTWIHTDHIGTEMIALEDQVRHLLFALSLTL